MSKTIRAELRTLLHSARQLSASEHPRLCALVAIALLQERADPQWLGSSKAPRPDWRSLGLSAAAAGEDSSLSAELARAGVHLDRRQRERLHDCGSVDELLDGFQLKGVGRDSQEGLRGWLAGRYPLDLLFDIPSPQAMLAHQCAGRRFVTLLLDEQRLFSPIGRHAGALEFLLHDLEHAHKFFADPLMQSGQQAFFRHLGSALDGGLFAKFLRGDPQFGRELDYLMADMNSHPVHLWKYLKAIALGFCQRHGPALRLTDFENELFDFWNWPLDVREAASRINDPGVETEGDRLRLSQHFTQPPTHKEPHALTH